MALSLRRLSHALGVEVCGVDVSIPMSEAAAPSRDVAAATLLARGGLFLDRGTALAEPAYALYWIGAPDRPRHCSALRGTTRLSRPKP